MTGYQEPPTLVRPEIVTLTYPAHRQHRLQRRGHGVRQDLRHPGLAIRDLLLRSQHLARASSRRCRRSCAATSSSASPARYLVGLAPAAREGRAERLHPRGRKGRQVGQERALKAARAFPGLMGMDLRSRDFTMTPTNGTKGCGCAAKAVPQEYSRAVRRWDREARAAVQGRTGSGFKVVAHDYGIKRNISAHASPTAAANSRSSRPGRRARRYKNEADLACSRPTALGIRSRATTSPPSARSSKWPAGSASVSGIVDLALRRAHGEEEIRHHGANHPVQDLDLARNDYQPEPRLRGG